MILRCSSLPRAMACPQSIIVPDGALAIGGTSEAADLGTAVHELLADYVRNDRLPDGKRKTEVAVKYGVTNPAGDLHFLFWTGVEAWRELRDGFQPDPMVEIPLSLMAGDLTLTGRLDVAYDAGETVRGLDWKSGRKPADYYPQMAGYAAELFAAFPQAQRASLTLAWLREKMVETLTWTRAESDAWLAELTARLASGVYCPGEACRYCPRQTDCPARTALVRSTLDDLTGAAPQLPALTAESWAAIVSSLGLAWERVKLVESAIDRFKAVVRDGVEKFGPLAVSDKTQVALVPVAARKSLDTVKAWPVVAEQLTEEELPTVTTISLSDVNSIVAKKAGRGKGKEAKEALLAALTAADAVIEKPQSPRLTEVRKDEKPKEAE